MKRKSRIKEGKADERCGEKEKNEKKKRRKREKGEKGGGEKRGKVREKVRR